MPASFCGPGPSPDLFGGLPSLSNMPLSAVLSAAGFRMGAFADIASPLTCGMLNGGGAYPGCSGVVMPNSSGRHAAPLIPGPPMPAPPLSATHGGGPMLGLSPFSVQGFVGDDAARLLEEALASPLSSQLSAARKSPRFHTGFAPRYS
jgi:hypothetical protein